MPLLTTLESVTKCKVGQMVTCCKGLPCTTVSSGEVAAGMTDHVGFIKLLCIYPQGRLGYARVEPCSSFPTISTPHHLAIMLQRANKADMYQKVQMWTPAEVQETSAFNSLTPLPPSCICTLERSYHEAVVTWACSLLTSLSHSVPSRTIHIIVEILWRFCHTC